VATGQERCSSDGYEGGRDRQGWSLRRKKTNWFWSMGLLSDG
jgi:hypothetical protein